MLMLVLGATLAKGPDSSGIGAEIVVAVALVRLVVMPCLGSICILWTYTHYPSAFDPVMLLVLFLQTCMPSAEALALISQLKGGQAAKDMSAVLFYQYIASPFSISVMASLALMFITSLDV